jgi:hypothetical protein
MVIRKATLRFALLIGIILCASGAARAQGDEVRLQTVSATLASNLACTGSPQDFTTAQGISGFINIGQTHHLATAISTASTFTMEIDGIDNAGNVFRLSDVQVGVPSSAQGGLVVEARGYMTNIQVQVTCTAAATFTLSYSGDFSTSPSTTAAALLASTDKLPFQTAAANTNSSTTLQPPSGNSSGTLIFQYAAAGPAGSTITVQCLSNAGADLALYTFSPATPAGAQLFPVSASACPFVTLSYASGGASATTYSLEYVFNPIGVQTTTNDPCTSGAGKMTSVVNPADAAATVQLIAGVTGKIIYPCTISIVAALSTSDTVQFEYGTGSTCTTPTALTGVYETFNTLPIVPIVQVSGPTVWNIPAGASVCAVLVGGGAQWGVRGFIGYVQQ